PSPGPRQQLPPSPTRRSSDLEVSDAAHAVGEGADAIMLSGETAIGARPAKTVATLARIILEAERMPSDSVPPVVDPTGSMHGRADRKSTRLNSSHVKISYAVF